VHQRYASALRKRDELFDRIKVALVGYPRGKNFARSVSGVFSPFRYLPVSIAP
jgi:hypothetical protein